MSTQTAPNKETQHLIDWIDTEYSLDRWFNKSVDELKAMTHSLFYSGLDTNRSVADTLNDLIIVVIQDRIDWEYLIKQIEKLQSDRMAD